MSRIIPQSEIESAAVENNLANRPSSVSRYGEGGLTPAQVKAAYDRLPRLVAEYLNALIESIEDGSILDDIPSGHNDGSSLADVIARITNGELLKDFSFSDGTSLVSFYNSFIASCPAQGSITIYPSSWSNLAYKVSMPDLGADDSVFFSPARREDALCASASGLFSLAAEEGASVTFTVEEIPSDVITLNYVIVRG